MCVYMFMMGEAGVCVCVWVGVCVRARAHAQLLPVLLQESVCGSLKSDLGSNLAAFPCLAGWPWASRLMSSVFTSVTWG